MRFLMTPNVAAHIDDVHMSLAVLHKAQVL
jgi:hypothetical protein